MARSDLFIGLIFLFGFPCLALAAPLPNDFNAVHQIALTGDNEAKLKLADMYDAGTGVTKDPVQAFAWRMEAAIHGSNEAMYLVSLAFRAGSAIPRDDIEAEKWAILAHQKGHWLQKEPELLAYYDKLLTPAQKSEAQKRADEWTSEQNSGSQPSLHVDLDPTPMPFQFIDSAIVVDATLNGHPHVRFMIDTGCNQSFIDPKIAPAIGLTTNAGYSPVLDGESRLALVKIHDHMDLRLASTHYSDVIMVERNLFADGDNRIYDGIIGSDLLLHAVVCLDFVHQTLRLLDPASFQPDKNSGTEISLWLENSYSPRLDTTIQSNDRSIRVSLLVDTGFAGPLGLDTKFVSLHPELTPHQEFASSGGSFDDPLENMNVAGLDNLVLGQYVLNRPAAAIFDQNLPFSINGEIGSTILRRFDVIIDYDGERMFLKPNAHFNDPFYYKPVGMQIRIDWNPWKGTVWRVLPGSSAAKAGFQPGDELISSGKTGFTGMWDGQIRDILEKPGKQSVAIQRKGKPIVLTYTY